MSPSRRVVRRIAQGRAATNRARRKQQLALDQVRLLAIRHSAVRLRPCCSSHRAQDGPSIQAIRQALVDLLAVRQKVVHKHRAELMLAGLPPGWSSRPSAEDADSLGEPPWISLEEASRTVMSRKNEFSIACTTQSAKCARTAWSSRKEEETSTLYFLIMEK